MKYIERTKEVDLRRFIELNQEHKDVLIVSGARQVGKTTLINHVLGSINKNYVSIDLEKRPSFATKIDMTKGFDEFAKLVTDELSFSPDNNDILFIDEAQISHLLGSYVRFMKEEWKKSTVIISGSLISELHNEDIRRPVGREKHLQMWPFTFKEFLKAIGHDSLVDTITNYKLGEKLTELEHERLLENYDIFLKVGGLPAVIDAYKSGVKWQDTIMDIFKTYEDDFVRYFGIENTNLFGRSLSALASNLGSPSKNSQIIKVDAPGYKKVSDILARLELWCMVIKVEQTGKIPEQLNFPPKRYLYDLGILNYLRFKGRSNLALSEIEDVFLKTAFGGMVENAVAISLKNQAREVVGMKLSKNSEIDFGIKIRDDFLPIECKASKKFKSQQATSIINYCKLFHLKRGLVFNLGVPCRFERGDIIVYSLPAYMVDETGRLFEHCGV